MSINQGWIQSSAMEYNRSPLKNCIGGISYAKNSELVHHPEWIPVFALGNLFEFIFEKLSYVPLQGLQGYAKNAMEFDIEIIFSKNKINPRQENNKNI